MSDERHEEEMEAPGTFVISLIFLALFVLSWLAHLKWITTLWGVK
ncbi:MAG: hypothetical protein V3W31_09365 [Thermodesulfobacteriota bacterium]